MSWVNLTYFMLSKTAHNKNKTQFSTKIRSFDSGSPALDAHSKTARSVGTQLLSDWTEPACSAAAGYFLSRKSCALTKSSYKELPQSASTGRLPH